MLILKNVRIFFYNKQKGGVNPDLRSSRKFDQSLPIAGECSEFWSIDCQFILIAFIQASINFNDVKLSIFYV